VGLRTAAVVRLEGALAHGGSPRPSGGASPTTPGIAVVHVCCSGTRVALTTRPGHARREMSARARQESPERLSHATSRRARGSNPLRGRRRARTRSVVRPATRATGLSTPGDERARRGSSPSTCPVGISVVAGRGTTARRALTPMIPAFAHRPSCVHRGVNDSAPFPTGCGQLCGQRSSVAD
jgi:hypothetical protein